MENENQQQTGEPQEPIEIDSWDKAIEAWDQMHAKPAQANGANEETAGEPGANSEEGSENIDATDPDSKAPQENDQFGTGGIGGNVQVETQATPGSTPVGGAEAGGIESQTKWTPEVIDRHVSEYTSSIETTAKQQVDAAMEQKGIRKVTPNDTVQGVKLYQVDQDGRPHFYNPDTGAEFTSEDPRGQMEQWLQRHNQRYDELREQAIELRKKELNDNVKPFVDTVKFMPKYEALNDLQRQMLDKRIAPHMITGENGQRGFTVDLNHELDMVNSDIKAIAEFAKAQKAQQSKGIQTQSAATPQASGPVVDMPASGTSSSESTPKKKEIKSLADAIVAAEEAKIESALTKGKK